MVSHTYENAGTYQVSLTTESDASCQSSIIKEIMIDDLQANFKSSPDTIACANVQVSFIDQSASSFYTIDAWRWSFGDNQMSQYQHPLHTYTTTGKYQVELSVSDIQNCEELFAKELLIVEQYALPEEFSLIAPVNNSYLNDTSITFSWNASENCFVYTFQLASDANFKEILQEKTGLENTSIKINVNYYQKYYWRVIAQNICRDKHISSTNTFYLFRENTIPGLELWLNAGEGISKGDSTITEWFDIAGNGNTARQTDFSDSQPVIIDSAPNSKHAIRFDELMITWRLIRQLIWEAYLWWLTGAEQKVFSQL